MELIEMNREVNIVELPPTEIKQAAALVAKTMATNLLHLAIFQSASMEMINKQQKMFAYALNKPVNKLYAAKLKDEIVGIMCYTTSENCQLKPSELFRALPEMVLALGRHLIPVLKWRKNWGKHDYPKPHIHFGPLAVSPLHQGKGIGKALLSYFCNYLDQTSQTGYLETDKKENVPLYEKFGFQTIEKDTIFGVKNWFMVIKI